MKKTLSALFLTLLVLSLAAAGLAQTVSVTGTVVSTRSELVSAAAGGTVLETYAAPGDSIRAGDPLVSLATRKVYALQDGVVHLFGEAGDDAASVTERYGAVAYIEPPVRYTVSASTKNAYALEENKVIHPGETVYLRATDNNQMTGVGRVTTVSGANFVIELISGNLESGKSVNIFRSEDYDTTTRLGRASVSLLDPVACTGEGLIVSFAVADGAQVKKGDVLFELLDGSYTGTTAGLDLVTAPADGTIASFTPVRGGSLSAGETVAEIYPDSGMRIEVQVNESDLHCFQAGGTVSVEFNYLNNGELIIPGTIEKISRLGGESTAEDSEEAAFSVWIIPDSTDGLSYGLHAVVTTADSAEAAAEDQEQAVENQPEQEPEQEAGQSRQPGQRRERSEGEGPQERPEGEWNRPEGEWNRPEGEFETPEGADSIPPADP